MASCSDGYPDSPGVETRYGHAGIGKAVRVALFESVSALTTTGFSTVSYVPWRPAALLVMLALMLVGGGTCSTAGGLKQYRVLVLLKSAAWEVRRVLLPRTSVVEPVVWMGEGGASWETGRCAAQPPSPAST